MPLHHGGKIMIIIYNSYYYYYYYYYYSCQCTQYKRICNRKNHSLFISTVDGECLASRPGRLTPEDTF